MTVRGITFVVAALAAVAPSLAQAKTRVYTIVVAQNKSLDPGVKPLRYADDDGVKDFELLSLYGEHSSLFVVMDDETAMVHPDAARMAEVPRKQAILDRLAHYNDLMAQDTARGDDPELFFVYAGHGDVDAAGQGYVNLFDGKLTRAELFHDVVAPSKARFVHVIIDACKSYFMVNSRGGNKHWVDDTVPADQDRSDQQVKAFLAAEDLTNYPRAGVIVATSGDQDTHEWARYQSGILSHELRSALSGAADVNGDGRIEYSELRAFLAAANARVRNPEARIEAFARPPALDRHHALVDLRNVVGSTRFLHFAPGLAGRFHIEDDRGVRWADLNKELAAGFDVMVSSQRGYYVMRGDANATDETEETEVAAASKRRIDLSSLKWRPRAIASRGALDQTFRADLYKVPYGRGFYDGYVATSGDLPVEEGGVPFLVVEPKKSTGRHRIGVGYLMTTSPAGHAGYNHGVDLRYGYNVWGPLEVGISAQVGYGSGQIPVAAGVNRDAYGFAGAADESLTRFATLIYWGASFLPVRWLSLHLDAGVGWQLLSGTIQLGTDKLAGTEPRGMRFEVAGGLGFNLTSNLWIQARGGLAVDGVYPTGTLPSSTNAGGFCTISLQFQL
jgi:hypothetical protein